jgi:hypothetical protein
MMFSAATKASLQDRWQPCGTPDVAGLIGFIRAGKLRALGVTSAARMDVLPDVPALDEFVPGYEGGGWLGVGAPKGTRAEIIERLNKEINAVIVEPDIKTRLVELGVEPKSMTPGGAPLAGYGAELHDMRQKKRPTFKVGRRDRSSCEPRFESRRGISTCAGARRCSPIVGNYSNGSWFHGYPANICRRSSTRLCLRPGFDDQPG